MMYETQTTGQTARLEDYLKAIRTRWPLVLIFFLLFSLVGWWAASSRSETYTARSAVALGPSPVGSTNPNTLSAPSVERESQVMASNDIARDVVDELSLDIEPAVLLQDLDVKYVPNSAVLEVALVRSDAEESAEILNSLTQSYVGRREAAAQQYYQEQVDVLEAQVASVEAEIDGQNDAIEAAQTERATVVATSASEERSLRLTEIDAELASLRSDRNQSFVALRTSETNLSAAELRLATRQETASVIRLAGVPSSADGIPTALIVAALGLLGIIFGIAAAFVLERLDTTARDEKSLGLALGSRVMGEIPNFGFGNRSGPASLIMLSDSSATKIQRTKEAFRRLRSSLQFIAPIEGQGDSLVVAVTSAYPGEGKSTVVANTAVALAQGGKRVGLVSADLRRPTLEGIFGLASDTGLSDYLGSDHDTPTVLSTAEPNLWLLPAGPAAANPSELLGSLRFAQLVKEVREDLDFVLIDTPPVLSTADALAVSSKTDGVLVVVDSRATDTDDLLQVRTELERSGAKILGGILNRDRRRRGSMFRRDRYAYNKLDA